MNRPSPSRRQQLIQHWGAILWPSFIAAGLASVVFFAFVDPLRLQAISFPARRSAVNWAYGRILHVLVGDRTFQRGHLVPAAAPAER
jgi:hypothetical protein